MDRTRRSEIGRDPNSGAYLAIWVPRFRNPIHLEGDPFAQASVSFPGHDGQPASEGRGRSPVPASTLLANSAPARRKNPLVGLLMGEIILSI